MRPQRPRRSDHQCRLPTGDAPTVDLSPRRQEADAKAAAEAEPPKEPEPVPAPAPVADEPVFEPAPAPEAAPSPVAEPAPAPAPAKPSSASKKKPLTKEAIEKMTVPKLKAALKKEKVNDLTGKKADLKARLLEKLGL